MVRSLAMPVAAAALSPSIAFVVPPPSYAGIRSTFRLSSSSSTHVSRRRPRRESSVCMMAKKKKGPAADALAQLEALEAMESEQLEIATAVQERPSTAAKKTGKKKKKGPAADALAQLEALEAEGLDEVEAGATNAASAPEETPVQEEAVRREEAASPVVSQQPYAPSRSHESGIESANLVQAGVQAGGVEGQELDEVGRMEQGSLAEAGDFSAARTDAAVDGDGEDEMNLMQPAMKAGKKGKRGKKKGGRPDDVTGSEGAQISQVPPNENVPLGLAQESEGTAPAQEEETLEAKIRKSRPPPRVRVSSSAQPGFVSLRLEGVAVTFRNQEIVKDATWDVKTGDRIGLVGPNGGGKTTQVKIMAGELDPTAGEVVKSSKDLRVAFLRQEFVDELVMERSLEAELTSAFTEEAKILDALQACEDELQLEEVQQDPDKMEQVLNKLTQLQEDAERKRVYDLGTNVQRIMDLMGFSQSEGAQPVSSFSGGWRMRIGLGKILLKDPNILLLDEPTNHLDMESVEWLESFLQNQNIPMVIVSHDREFLDRVCTGIVDTDGGVATSYPGNYSNFLKLKRTRMESWQAAYRNQQKKIKDERNWINKFRTKGAWASQVKSREKALEKLIAGEDYVKQPPNMGKPFRFRFPPAPRTGSEEILVANGVTHGYNGRTLFENVSLSVDKGERIAFLGPNGAGKSTLLRLVVGEEQPQSGTCTLGSSVVKQYFEQNQADALDLSKTVIDTMMSASKTEKYEDLRKLLGQFLFKGDAVEKSVAQLSGGEKARVALCKMMLTPANLLVLDEPTNHLDIPAKEMLEEALQHYEGSVLVVSHDRYFVSQVAKTICNFEDKHLARYDGDYRYFLERNDNILEKVEARYVAGVAGIQKAKRVDLEQLAKSGKSFGGKGGPSGRKDKGVKNAKRNVEKAL